MSGADRFDLFIQDMLMLYDALHRDLSANRARVTPAGRRALAVLKAYRPLDDGEAILIETAIEQFEDLVDRASGARG